MDCAVIPLRRHNLSLVQTVDFFYPLIDEPETMGAIALANVVSDVYAVGVTEIDELSMIISSPTEFTDEERDIVMPLLMKGFSKAAQLAGCRRLRIQSVALNPWCMIGGIATSVCTQSEVIMPSKAKCGDLLVLTKPLGTQLATNAYTWLQENHEKYQKLSEFFTDKQIEQTFLSAVASMQYLNRNAALCMQKHNAHSATDVTGFGLLGHAANLAEFTKDCLTFRIDKLPIIGNVLEFGRILGMDTKLRAGMSVETSGGLLIALPAANASNFCADFETMTKGAQHAWIVGEVVAAPKRTAVMADAVEFIEVIL